MFTQVLCKSFKESVECLQELGSIFRIVRVKSRIGPGSKDGGNKTILVNVVVEGASVIKPHKYAWSGWWDKQSVRMIAEVCNTKTRSGDILALYSVSVCVRDYIRFKLV